VRLCGLPRTAALCTLARTLYETWATTYDLQVPEWYAITPEERHVFVARASDMLDVLDPDPCPLPLFNLVTTARVLRFPPQEGTV
jgi:hypothetical protein